MTQRQQTRSRQIQAATTTRNDFAYDLVRFLSMPLPALAPMHRLARQPVEATLHLSRLVPAALVPPFHIDTSVFDIL